MALPPGVRLVRIVLHETPRNAVEYLGDTAPGDATR
jgi:hypothetical protein